MIIFSYDNADISKTALFSTAKRLTSDITHLKTADYTNQYANVCVPFDESALNVVEIAVKLKRALHPSLIVVIGIGGSNLGAQAIHRALNGAHWNLEHEPNILFADTVDPDQMSAIIERMQHYLRAGKQVLLNCVTKSGTTTETIANFEVLLNVLKRHRRDSEKYVVVTTDRDSKLWHLALKNNWSVLEIPAHVGGRYSVFTAAGLFPLGMLGANIRELLSGARDMIAACTAEPRKNPAAIGASMLYHHSKKYNIHDAFFFATDLEDLGKWHRQLLAESCGKKNKKGKAVGIMPVVSIGTTDLHSTAQLYLGGPRNTFTTFVATTFNSCVTVPSYQEYNTLVTHLQKKELNAIMHATFEGVKRAYKKQKLPFAELRMDGKTAYNLGAFMQLKMIETILLARLLGVNPFDQPAVDLYKRETRALLARQSFK